MLNIIDFECNLSAIITRPMDKALQSLLAMTLSRLTWTRLLGLCLTLPVAAVIAAGAQAPVADCEHSPRVCLNSLADISTDALRSRSYGSELKLLKQLPQSGGRRSFMLGYSSDGLALYSRLDLPAGPAAEGGYPVLLLAPGWISKEQALLWDFGADSESTHGTIIAAFTRAGFAVITAGYRGRGTVDGVPAAGMAFRDAWGNGSYLSPIFYAIDVLNLLAGLGGLERLDWGSWLPANTAALRFDLDRVSLWGHSQGGDVGLTVLAVSGHNPRYPQKLFSASLWCGNIPDRFTQADTFGAMASTTQAFLSGDGTWTGSARGKNGKLNRDFIFPWPADWIGTLDTRSEEWTWQARQWSTPTVAAARKAKYEEMYAAINRYVNDMRDVGFSMERDANGRSTARHAPTVAAIMPTLGGFHYAGYMEAPLALHISDRDYYSLPAWNQDLAERIHQRGGEARVYIYPGNTHALKRSKHRWFSPEGTVPGAPIALARDTRLFQEGRFAD